MSAAAADAGARGPYHAGERLVQERAGTRAMAERNGRIVSRAVPAGAHAFVAEQSWMALARCDRGGVPWCGWIGGEAGFATVSADGTTIAIRRPAAAWCWDVLASGEAVGLLFIELATRRRLRVNGHLHGVTADGFTLQVDQAFPNCPQYIQRRTPVPGMGVTLPAADLLPRTGDLDAEALAVLAAADTALLGTRHPQHGCDASHRGGQAGFITAHAPTRLSLPDLAGNGMFTSFGNLAVDGRLALAVADFAGGRQLLLSGTGEVRWPEPAGPPQAGAGRTLAITVQAWCWTELPGAGWSLAEAAPFMAP